MNGSISYVVVTGLSGGWFSKRFTLVQFSRARAFLERLDIVSFDFVGSMCGHSATGADSVSLRDGAAHGAGLGHPDGNHGEINNPASLRGFL
ncbi:MAG: hypothetical protein NTZ64_18860 [Polaromonas sp.]|nr:hypothetical protein [Polaromonas sp.]